jgi:biopolymer transport protein ExbD
MPVHSAGPRLYRSIKFKQLVKGHGSAAAGGRSSNIALNLTPFVDMMTILVTFLLMVFSSSGQLLQAQKGLELPKADSKDTLQEAPVIIVTKTDITYKGVGVLTVENALKDDSQKIDALSERLTADAAKIKADVDGGSTHYPRDLIKSCEEAEKNQRQPAGKICPKGLAILQADEGTDARIINKIVITAKASGFDNLLFAVKNKN